MKTELPSVIELPVSKIEPAWRTPEALIVRVPLPEKLKFPPVGPLSIILSSLRRHNAFRRCHYNWRIDQTTAWKKSYLLTTNSNGITWLNRTGSGPGQISVAAPVVIIWLAAITMFPVTGIPTADQNYLHCLYSRLYRRICPKM